MSENATQRPGKPRSSTRFFHPLLGSNLGTLREVFKTYGPADSSARWRVAAAYGAALGRWPFSTIEKAWVAATQSRQPATQAPVFILGHWRSGTTHLYNLMACDRRFGYVSPLATGMPWDFLILGRLLGPILNRVMPRDRLIDNIPVTPTSPQEDEIALASMTRQSFFHGLFFPEHLEEALRQHVFFDETSPEEVEKWCETFRYFLGKVQRQHRGRRLMIKNPVYTARVALLHRLFPDARFIHVHRHPEEVFRSTKSFYSKLLPWLALQKVPELDMDRIILEVYVRMMESVIEESKDLPPDQFVEIGFSELEESPMEVMESIYGRLGLGEFGSVRSPFQSYLDSISGYRKNPHSPPASDRERVYEQARSLYEHWGYPQSS